MKRAGNFLKLARTFFAKDDFKKAMDYTNKAKNTVRSLHPLYTSI